MLKLCPLEFDEHQFIKEGENGQKNIVTNEENILENCCTGNKRIYQKTAIQTIQDHSEKLLQKQ